MDCFHLCRDEIISGDFSLGDFINAPHGVRARRPITAYPLADSILLHAYGLSELLLRKFHFFKVVF